MHIDEAVKAIKACRSNIANLLSMRDQITAKVPQLERMLGTSLDALKDSEAALREIINGEAKS